MNKCEKCGIDHDGKYASGRFCSSKCSRSYSTSLKRKEINEKVSQAMSNISYKRDANNVLIKEKVKYISRICPICSSEFEVADRSRKRMFCNKKCASVTRNINFVKAGLESLKQRIKNGTHKGWASRNTLSYPEKFFKEVLEKNGYEGKFLINHPVKKTSLGLDCSANYFLDFYFPQINFDLEIDGLQHNLPERRIKDQERDEALKNSGYVVYRIKWNNINNEKGRNEMKEKIQQLFNFLESFEPETIV